MKRMNVTSLALAAGCVIALAVPAAQAQSYDRSSGNPALNNAESAKYDRMLETSPGFRQARMRKECAPISDPQLRQNCFASFAQYEPSTGSRSRTMARGTTFSGDFYTGSSTNPGMTNPGITNYDQSTHYGSEWGGLGTTPNNPGPRPSGSGGGSTDNGAGR